MTRTRWIATFLIALLPLMGWWTTGLFDLDEGFYAAVVAEMNRRGEWITPFYNGKPWFEKPILLYWLAKPSLLLFGEAIGPRLPSVLSTLATFGVVGAFARRRLGEGSGPLAVLFLASSLLVVALGRMMMTDAPLMLAMTGAYLAFYESLVSDRRWRLLTAFLLGVGVLAKGPVAGLLFLPVVAWTYAREPELRPAFRGQWLAGSLIFAVVVASWYLPAYLASGDLFVQKFLIEQNIGRFTGGDAAHTLGVKSMPAYIPIVLLGMFPWSLWIATAWPWRKPVAAEAEWFLKFDGPVAAVIRWTLFLPLAWTLHGWYRRQSGCDQPRRFLATWAIVIFLFFSLSGAKLPHYILPMFPALALLVAHRLRRQTWSWPVAAGTTVTMALVANLGFAWWYGASGQRDAHNLARYVRNQGGDAAVYQLSRRQRDRGTGGTKLQETSLPSLLLYLNRSVIDTDDSTKLFTNPQPLWIITRPNRITTAEMLAAARQGKRLERIMGAPGGANFHLYRLTSQP